MGLSLGKKRTLFYGKRISIKAIASIVLPTQISDYFLVVGVEQAATEIESSLDELPDKELTDDIHFDSKGFMEPVHVTEFPIRNQLELVNQ
ncbi:MAG: hypothetical protein MR404_07960 [Prevotellaceae bacterium]|nr:hypothetical protein [Prevotellaceae bacterium]